MIIKKHITSFVLVLMTAAVIVCFLAVAFSDKLTEILGGTGVTMEYETELFDTDEIISVDIQIDEETWNELLDNALSEEYYVCDVTINGKTIKNVAIRPKGNTSLSSIAKDDDTDRYSFKLEFGHYVEGQTCYGLDKLILNNNYADATNMKEAIIYDMYQYLDADASLYNYAEVSVNGEYWGVYLALEGVEESFMLRNYGTQDGELYKPETMGGGNNSSESSHSSKSGGADLNYTDEELESYSTIWDGEVTGTSDSDHRRVVKALKNISEGNDLEEYLDVDNILKYMAVHTFAVNMDSLSGTMTHNYYLYEYNGQLNIIPWDYNLSFGGMGMGGSDATDTINDAIDTPFQSTDFFDALLENEEYLERYHEYLQQLVDEYVNGGRFEQVYSRIRSQIDSLVETDPTAFYTYYEYQEAADTLFQVIMLRAESIQGQLDGTIASTDEGQKTDTSNFVDASDINLSVMGQMNMGGGGQSRDSDKNLVANTDDDKTLSGNAGDSDRRPDAPPDRNSNDGQKGSENGQNGDELGRPSGGPGEDFNPGEFNPSNMPEMKGFGGGPGESNSITSQTISGDNVKNLAIYGGLFGLMLISTIVIFCIKRRR